MQTPPESSLSIGKPISSQAVLIFSLLLAGAWPTASPLRAATMHYTAQAVGNLSSDWNNRTNWSSATVPTAADDVVISSWTVFLPPTAEFASLTVAGGAVKGQFTNRGIIHWTSGTFGGHVTIAAGGVLELSGNDQKNFEESTIDNSGTIRWKGSGGLQSSTSVLINNQVGGVFEAQNDGSFQHFSFSAPAVFNNAGVFRKNGGTNVTVLQNVSFENSGRVEIQTGTMSFPNGLANNGTFDVAAGARLELVGGRVVLQPSGTLTGAGFYGVTGRVDVDGIINSPNFQLTGILEGTNTLTGRMVWTTGTIKSKLTIAPSGVLDLGGNDQKVLEECAIENAGTIRWNGTGGLQSSTAVVVNNQTGGVFEAQNDCSFQHFSFSVPATFNNAGVFRKNGGTNVTLVQNVAFNNSGKVEIQTGAMSFPGGLANTGSIEVAAGARLELVAGRVVLQPSGTLAGAGFYGVTGRVDVDGTINSPNFQMTGILEGTNTLTGRMVWTTGTVKSKLAIAPGGVLDLNGNDQKILEECTIENSGTIRWNGTGGLQSSTAVVVNNQTGGIFEAQSDASFQHFSISAPSSFNNFGVFRKNGGINVTLFQNVAFNNSGKVEIRSGTLEFSGDYPQSAGATVLGGGTLKATAVRIEGGVLEGIGSVSGNILNRGQLSPAALVVDGDYTQTADGALNLGIGGIAAGGQFDTLTINGKAIFGGTLNVTLRDGFQPRPGNNFQVATYASAAGAFASMKGVDLGGGLTIGADFRAKSLVLSLPSPITLSRDATGRFKLRFEGKVGVSYRLEVSDDLTNWVALGPGLLTGIIEFTDAESISVPRRYYRVRAP